MVKVLVFAATGRVGGALCARLKALGQEVHGVTRGRAVELEAAGIIPVVADVADGASLTPRLAGFDSVFLASADAPDQDRTERGLIGALQTGGSPHVVKLSAQSAGLDPPVSFGVQHRNTEIALVESGLPYTLLRPTFFQQSLLLMADDVARKSTITAPMGKGRTAMIDVRDIADAAAVCLTNPEHRGQTYTLTGPGAHGFDEIAEKLSGRLGRKIKYSSPPAFAARIVMPFMTGMPRWQTSLIIDLMVAIKKGAQEPVSGDFEALTGKPARCVDDFLDENFSAFQG